MLYEAPTSNTLCSSVLYMVLIFYSLPLFYLPVRNFPIHSQLVAVRAKDMVTNPEQLNSYSFLTWALQLI